MTPSITGTGARGLHVRRRHDHLQHGSLDERTAPRADRAHGEVQPDGDRVADGDAGHPEQHRHAPARGALRDGAGSTFALSPTTANLGTINRNSTKTQTITVRNSGTIAFRVGQPAISGSGASAYSVTGAGCIGTTLAAGRTCNLTVTFRPVLAQAYTATLDVLGDASSLPAKVSATLTGSGK